MDLIKIESTLVKWTNLSEGLDPYRALQKKALTREIYQTFTLPEILYLVTRAAGEFPLNSPEGIISPPQRFALDLIQCLSAQELEQYVKLVKKCSAHLREQGKISPEIYELKWQEISREPKPKSLLSHLIKSLRAKKAK